MDDPFYKTPQFAAYNLGRLYEKKGDIERALSYYQQAVKFDPHYGMAWFRIGQILEQLHRADEARHAYGNAVRASPDLAEAHLRFGIMSYQAGDLEAALRSLSRVGEIAPNTDMADEARKYLEKLNAAARTKTRPRPHPTRLRRNRSHLERGPPAQQIKEVPQRHYSPTPPQVNSQPAGPAEIQRPGASGEGGAPAQR